MIGIQEESIIIFKKTCYIRNFILKLHFSKLSKSDEVIIDYFKENNINVKLKKKKKIYNINPQIFSINKKIVIISQDYIPESKGKIIFEWESRFQDFIEYNFNYIIVENPEEATSIDDFIEFFQKSIIKKYQEFEQYSISKANLHKLIGPQIGGIKSDLNKYRKKIYASYKFIEKNNSIEILDERANYRWFRYGQRKAESYNSSSINIEIKNKIYSITKTFNDKFWKFQENGSVKNIPSSGILALIPFEYNLPYKSHDQLKLASKLDSLRKMRDDISSPGYQTLSSTFESKIDRNDVEKISYNFEPLKQIYLKLNDDKKELIDDFHTGKINIITGEAGSGKTEIGAFLANQYENLHQKTLIVSETNEAINNFLRRILKQNKDANDKILRLKAKTHNLDLSLDDFNIDKKFANIKERIEEKCSRFDSESEKKLKQEFQESFSIEKNLEEALLLTKDIILSTYGNLANKFDILQNYSFDLNIIDACSSINFSSMSISANRSYKWLFLGDSNQIEPIIETYYLPYKPIRFPTRIELDSAISYDLTNLQSRKYDFTSSDYKKNVLELFEDYFSNFPNERIKFSKLNHQYRIQPDLYKDICDIFELNESENYFENVRISNSLIKKSSILDSTMRLKYHSSINNDDLREKMINFIVLLVKEFNTIVKTNESISIGITCMDSLFLESLKGEFQKISKLPIKNFNLNFNSFKNFQEKEVEIMIIGMNKYRMRSFRKILYSTITRASEFSFLFGPKVFPFSKNEEEKIIERLMKYEGDK